MKNIEPKKVIIDGKAIDVKKTRTAWSVNGPTPVWLGKFIFYWGIFLGVATIGMEYFAEFMPENVIKVVYKCLLFSVPALTFLKKALGLKEK